MRDLITCLQEHAEHGPDRIAVQLVSARKPHATRTFAEVIEGARRAAAAYLARGVGQGDVVVLVGTHHIDFYAAWLGVVWLGGIPTVIAEPSVRIDRGIYSSRLQQLLARIDARFLALDPSVCLDQLSGLAIQSYEELAAAPDSSLSPYRPRPSDLLLLQHSSGTTGLQKGVMLSHGAVTLHTEAYAKALGATRDDVIASWLPLYHDMGLIACFVLPLYLGMKVVWLSPFEWVANPAMLLDAISAHRATLTWLPNFAFQFLAHRARANATYDLSSLRAVVNCSEPVTYEAVESFRTRFVAQGLRPDVLHACYALAENVFAVSTSNGSVPSRVIAIDRDAWLDEHRVVLSSGEGPSVRLVSNGRCIEGCEVRILDPDDRSLPPGQAGRVCIKSDFLFDGYFRRDDLNPQLFDLHGFFDTGDVGLLDEHGHLYITGRLKDLIIVGGRNIYPQDIEQIANETEGVHRGRVVAFGVPIEHLGTEGLVVLVESDVKESEWPVLARRIKHDVSARLDIDVLDARVVPRMELRKSTSGKLARSGNRDWYLEGRFGALPRAITLKGDA